MALTAKQDAFAQAFAGGLEPSGAYRHAYNAENMKPAVIANNAYVLLQRSDIAVRVNELRQAVTEKLIANRVWDVERFIEESETNLKGARSDGQWAPANGALSLIGKAIGVLTDKVDVNVTHTLKPGLSLEELEARVRRLDALESGVVEGQAVVLDDSDKEEE